MRKKLNNILEPKKNELTKLRQLYVATQKQVDDAAEQGNRALLDLQNEYDELAEKKRNLLREVEKLEERIKHLSVKKQYVENTYGEYLKEVKRGIENDEQH